MLPLNLKSRPTLVLPSITGLPSDSIIYVGLEFVRHPLVFKFIYSCPQSIAYGFVPGIQRAAKPGHLHMIIVDGAVLTGWEDSILV